MIATLLRRPARLGRARATDAPAIAAILSDWTDETQWIARIHSREAELAFVRDLVARGWVTVARREGRVVGFLAQNADEVVALHVAAGARGQGVGAALLGRARRGRARLALWTYQFNTPARAFYERHGFVEVARTGGAGNDAKLPDIRYEWRRRR